MTLLEQTKILLKEQLKDWELAGNNYNGLKKVKTKELHLSEGAVVKVQFNPERIRSSAAKVDPKSIQERPCFLCKKNRPKEQDILEYNDSYSILVNPYPIFPEHLTIPSTEHIEQLIQPHFTVMLNLAKELEDFTVFYNGPKSGASAPDHFHFQAGIKGFMPIEDDYRNGKYAKVLGEVNEVQLLNWKNYNRSVITLDSKSCVEMTKAFNQLCNLLQEEIKPEESEPMLNILAYYENERFIVHIFPRVQHRPDCYFAKGDEQILLSPASVDLGGVFVTPREEDFEKITANDISAILKQVCMEEVIVSKIVETLLEKN